MIGGTGNDTLTGGAGGDTLDGGVGSNIASYTGSSAGVTINLTTGVNAGGDAQGDTLTNIENVYGSTLADMLSGDAQANTLIGYGGADTIKGMDGKDRIGISATPTLVDGGADTDTLFIQNAASVTLTDANFTAIERVVIGNGSSVDMSGVTTAPALIRSTSAAGGGASIIGTQGADRIVAGQGADTITGGPGTDKIFAGIGNDTFGFASSGFGSDTIYRADLAKDTFDVAGLASSMGDLRFYASSSGADTIVEGLNGHLGDAIVLKGLTMAAVQAGGQFTFL